MVQHKSRYTRARRIFLVMFLLSTCLAFVCGFLGSLTNRWMWGSTDIWTCSASRPRAGTCKLEAVFGVRWLRAKRSRPAQSVG